MLGVCLNKSYTFETFVLMPQTYYTFWYIFLKVVFQKWFDCKYDTNKRAISETFPNA